MSDFGFPIIAPEIMGVAGLTNCCSLSSVKCQMIDSGISADDGRLTPGRIGCNRVPLSASRRTAAEEVRVAVGGPDVKTKGANAAELEITPARMRGLEKRMLNSMAMKEDDYK